MKPILILVFSLFIGFASAQETSFNKFQLGLSFSPDLSYRALGKGDGEFPHNFIIASRNSFERPKIGYTGGVNLGLNFSSKLGVEAGLQFSNKGYKASYNENSEGNEIIKYQYRYYYLDIPLKLNYFLGNGKLRCITSAGIVSNILLFAQNKSIWEIDGHKSISKSDATANFRRFSFSPMISVGLDYRINQKLSFRLEPTFRYALLSIVDFPIKERPWTAGLNIGCYLGL